MSSTGSWIGLGIGIAVVAGIGGYFVYEMRKDDYTPIPSSIDSNRLGVRQASWEEGWSGGKKSRKKGGKHNNKTKNKKYKRS